MTNEELSKALAEHEGWAKALGDVWTHNDGRMFYDAGGPPYATSWEWTGPLLERFWGNEMFFCGVVMCVANDEETLLRAICLAVLEIEE